MKSAPAVTIVDEKEMRLGMLGQIALSDVLTIAGEIGEGDRLIVEHAQKSWWAAAMPNIQLPFDVCLAIKMLVCAAMNSARSGVMRVFRRPAPPVGGTPGVSPCAPAGS